ncbi:MAG: hypothetical protein ACKVP0_05305 [Pirellulaceae bacterium]
MDKESDVIKHQMEHTRAALTDKLELLEHQVSDTMTGAAETVERVRQTVQNTVSGAAETVASMQHCIQDTVQSVRESVRETAESVSETLDVCKQVEKHPWAMMAGATAVGFGVGILVTRVDVPVAASSMAASMRSNGHSSGVNNGGWSEQQNGRDDRNGRAQQVESPEEPVWAPAVNQLKGLAIGAMFGVLREILAKSMPDALNGQVGEVINGFTTSLGGKPITGKILPDSWGGGEDRQADQVGQKGFPRPRQTAMADVEE